MRIKTKKMETTTTLKVSSHDPSNAEVPKGSGSNNPWSKEKSEEFRSCNISTIQTKDLGRPKMIILDKPKSSPKDLASPTVESEASSTNELPVVKIAHPFKVTKPGQFHWQLPENNDPEKDSGSNVNMNVQSRPIKNNIIMKCNLEVCDVRENAICPDSTIKHRRFTLPASRFFSSEKKEHKTQVPNISIEDGDIGVRNKVTISTRISSSLVKRRKKMHRLHIQDSFSSLISLEANDMLKKEVFKSSYR